MKKSHKLERLHSFCCSDEQAKQFQTPKHHDQVAPNLGIKSKKMLVPTVIRKPNISRTTSNSTPFVRVLF